MLDVTALTNLTTKELVKLLKVRHAWWTKIQNRLNQFRDFRNKEIDPRKYLEKGKIEPDADYDLRCKLAIFAPETPRIVNRIMGFLRRVDCSRSDLDEYSTWFVKQADKRGRSLTRLTLATLEDALYLGSQFILVDRAEPPMSPDGTPVIPNSVLENERAGNPFCVVYQPEQLVNWKYGDGGGFDWIVLREEVVRQATPLDPRVTVIAYRIFDRDSWIKIELIPKQDRFKNKEAIASENSPDSLTASITTGQHNLGIVPLVPVVPFPLRDDRPAQGVSFVDDSVDRDILVFQQESDHIYNQYLHMHPQLVIKSDDVGAFIALQTASAIILKPADGEDAFYIGPPADIFQTAKDNIQQNRRECWIATGQEAASRIAQTGAQPGEESGYHKRLSFEIAEGAILGYFSDVIVSVEQSLFECVARYMSSKNNIPANEQAFKGKITRSKSFDLLWIGDFIEQFNKAKDSLQYSPTFMRMAIERIARAMLDNPAQEIIDLIGKDLDDSKPYLSNRAETILSIVDALKQSAIPSQEFLKQLFIMIARILFPPDEAGKEPEILNAIIDEIQESEIETNPGAPGLFDNQFDEESTGDAGQQ